MYESITDTLPVYKIARVLRPLILVAILCGRNVITLVVAERGWAARRWQR